MEMPKPYEKYLERFDLVISAATAISQGAAGRSSESNKHYWASVIFTRLCSAGVSLLLSLPKNRFVKLTIDHWDYSAISALSRQLLESYLTFYYLCVDSVSEDEWTCRWNIFNLNDCNSRIRLFRLLNSTEEMHKFSQKSTEIITRLRNNKYFLSLPEKQQKMYLKGRKPFLLSQDEIIEKFDEDKREFRFYYEFLSAHVHTLPLSFYRTGESGRGRGVENRVEKNYICMTLQYLDSFIVRAIYEMSQLFPGSENNISTENRQLILNKMG